MPPNPRAAQELDLLLQEGQADNPHLIEGLVKFYANDLFRFAWELHAHEADNPTVQRLLARRTVAQALIVTLRQINRFQEQPNTFLWLFKLTFEQAKQKAEGDLAVAPALAFLQPQLPPEDIAYILKIPERRVIALSDEEPVSAGERSAIVSLTPAEITSLIERVKAVESPPPRAGLVPRFFREFAFIGLALAVFISLVRATPSSVLLLPTPVPSPTSPGASALDWSATPVALPTSTNPLPTDRVYEPENPYLVWKWKQMLIQDRAYVTALAFSPTDPILAVGDNQNQLTIWDTSTLTIVQELEAPTSLILNMAWSRDGALLATAHADETVRIWEMPAGFVLRSFDGHRDNIQDLAFSASGETLAVTANRELWLWSVNEGTVSALPREFDRNLLSVRYSPDGTLLTVSEVDGTAWVLRALDGAPLLNFKIRANTNIQNPLLFTPDGEYLLSVSPESQPMVIRLTGDTNHLKAEVVKYLFATGENIYVPSIRAMALAPDGQTLAVTTEDGSTYLWDTATWSPLQAQLGQNDFGGQSRHLSVSSDNRLIAVSQMDGNVGIWHLEDVASQVGQLPDPVYFERLSSDIFRWRWTYPSEIPPESEEADPWSIDRISESIGFTVKLPLIRLLEGEYQLDEIYYNPGQDGVLMFFSAINNDPRALLNFTLIQHQFRADEDDGTEESFVRGYKEIGISAIVEPVRFNNWYGEFISGGWAYFPEENSWSFEFQQPGDQVEMVGRWSASAGNQELRWVENGVLFQIITYLDSYSTELVYVRDAMGLLASHMYAPEQAKIPWNARSFEYVVEAGDTCEALAQRYFTSVETIISLNRLAEECDIVAGQTLLVPEPAEPFTTTDLNCDGSEEMVVLLHDVNDPAVIKGIALDILSPNGLPYRAWEYSTAEFGAPPIQSPELFSMGDCEQLIAWAGGTDTAGLTRVFRWDGSSMWPVLGASGWPASQDGLIASLAQDPDAPFMISIIEYAPNLHPAAGPCPNEITDYLWNGRRFEAETTRTVLGECKGG